MNQNRTRRSGRAEDGFTLIELMIVVAMIGILAAIAVPMWKNAPDRAREAVLKTDLHTMRESIDQYFADKAKYPDSLQTLVDEGYMRKLPVDPFTNSSSTWRLIYAGEAGEMSEDLSENDPQGSASPGIFDVRSGAGHMALDGTLVSEW